MKYNNTSAWRTLYLSGYPETTRKIIARALVVLLAFILGINGFGRIGRRTGHQQDRGEGRRHQTERSGQTGAHQALAPAIAVARALAPAASRSLRSDRLIAPPSAISSGPPKISRAQGFQ